MLYYKTEILGPDKEWIVFIHPLGGSINIWSKQVEYFKKYFNILLVDLHGHGQSITPTDNLSFENIAQDVLHIIDQLKIESAYFIGMCIGNMIIDAIYYINPKKVRCMVMGGAIRQLTFRNKMLLALGNCFKKVVPHTFLYGLFAFIMMPKQHHKKSRNIFIREAKKMKHSDFINWYNLILTTENFYESIQDLNSQVKRLYIFGSEDYLFLSDAKDYVNKICNSQLHIIDAVGHMCNLENANEFNEKAISFIKQKPDYL